MAVRYNNIEVSAFEHSGTKLRGLTDFSIEPLDGTFKVDVNKALVAEILTTENDKPPTQSDIEDLQKMTNHQLKVILKSIPT